MANNKTQVTTYLLEKFHESLSTGYRPTLEEVAEMVETIDFLFRDPGSGWSKFKKRFENEGWLALIFLGLCFYAIITTAIILS